MIFLLNWRVLQVALLRSLAVEYVINDTGSQRPVKLHGIFTLPESTRYPLNDRFSFFDCCRPAGRVCVACFPFFEFHGKSSRLAAP